MRGLVDRVIENKGYGFIKGEDGIDYFFHQTDLNGFFEDLVEDTKHYKVSVEFTPTVVERGPRAAGVTRLDSGTPTTATR